MNLNYKYDKNVVYKIPCNDYNQVYIGQTQKLLNNTKETENILNMMIDESKLLQHKIDKNHKINYEEVQLYPNQQFKLIELNETNKTYTNKTYYTCIIPIYGNVFVLTYELDSKKNSYNYM